ncbi:MAG: hypothetical protein ACTTH5_07800 [Wolinella sp.]
MSAVAEDNKLDSKDHDDREKAKEILRRRRKTSRGSHIKDELSNTSFKVSCIRNYIVHALDEDRRCTNIDVKQAVENLPFYIGKVKSLFENKK